MVRAGCKLYNGFEIPEHAVIFTSKKGVEYYLSGSDYQTGKTTIRYLDTGNFQEIDTILLTDKIDRQRIIIDAYWYSAKQPVYKVNNRPWKG